MKQTDNSGRTILVTARLEDSWKARIQEIAPDFHVESRPWAKVGDISNELWKEVEILFTLNTFPTPEQAPNLRWVQLYSAGANQAFDSPLAQSKATITTASGVHAVNIAEYTLTTMLAWFHRFPRFEEWKQKGQWPDEQGRNLFMPEELRGKTLNVVGYGSIGREVARLARAFGMRIIAMEQRPDHRDHGFIFPDIGDPEGKLPDHYYPKDQFHQALAESDVVVAAVPLTPDTRGMFDAAAFRAMKDTTFFVNIARGDVCNEADLIHALKEKEIAGAALDVFTEEPLPSSSPLFGIPNVFMSPHISGMTPHYDERVAMIFTENLRRYVKGEPLYNAVDRERGY
ncbi:D-2-hydroxyacid dehydrogenase [Dictyobacter kobayashii]|uniref:3-phosphoglycerate dehydrogenase n=1 Tax=Dictyobacter kobayashii TaxID=2014872 RepID=A0A402ADB6_9CHLR|nr:D-2-hydroxyacid dehydrogenase [Dictyobacter kobayashii]GCE17085.1 3-phosphoglycerate dehydrogenase [Dictyobacter kobayashii]